MTTFLHRWLAPLLLLAFCLGILTSKAGPPPLVSDTWFHLRLGEEFLGGWSVSSPGHFGRYDSADWVPTQWLSQIGMALVVERGGLAALVWLFTALKFLLVTGLYFVCRRHAAPLAAALATVPAWFALLPGLSERPQVLSYLFFLLLVLVWHRQHEDGRVRWWPVLLVWAWVPLHGMWIVGLATLAVISAATWLEHRPGRRGTLALAGVPILGGLAALLTPVGADAYTAALGVGSRAAYFVEWGHPDLLRATNTGLLFLLAVVVLAWVRGPRVRWGLVAMLGLAAGFSVYSDRTVPFAVLLLAPLAAEVLQKHLPASPRLSRPEVLLTALVPVACLAVLALQLPDRTATTPAPAWVDRELEALPDGTPVLTGWNSGAYMLWAHPGLETVMHGYGDVFTDEELERNSTIHGVGRGWREAVEGLHADYAVVETDTHLGDALVDEAGWRVLEEDGTFRFLAAPGAE